MVAKAKNRSLLCHITTFNPRWSRASVNVRLRGSQIATAKGPRSIGQISSPSFSQPASSTRESGHAIASRGVNSNPREHVIAIVEPHIRRDQRPARASPRLAVELVLGRHAHQHVDKADAVAGNDFGSIGAVLTQRIRRPFEVVPGHWPAVEA